jgi:8-oxo-dGTP pyrophosphatase MutT (NUDIX family)
MEAGETKEEAMVRELKEELGVEVTTQKFRGSVTYVHKNKVFLLHYMDVTMS